MALSGLCVAGFCLWFWWSRSKQLSDAVHQLNLSGARYNGRLKLAKQERLPTDASDDERERYRIETYELVETRAEHEAQKKKQKREGRRLDILASVMACGGFAGLILSLVGFAQWYYKLQRLQDDSMQHSLREQKAKADLAEVELKRARSAPRP